MKYHFRIHKGAKGYWAECIEIDFCQTQASNLKRLKANMREVLNLVLAEPPTSKMIFPAPRSKVAGRNIVQVEVDPSVAIALRIRQLRLQNELTQVAMKEKLGIKHLSNYQRLEDPERANPEWKTLLLIKKAFPHFRLDDLMS